MTEYTLQSRWVRRGGRLEYYGMRRREYLFRNTVRLGPRRKRIIGRLPSELSRAEISALGPLFGTVVVAKEEYRPVPRSLAEARFCRTCPANDFMIPGLELDEEGICPMCRTADDVKRLRSVVPLVSDIPRSGGSDFDAALFYTGGKDSTFLLWWLAVKKKLRVLAMTWEIPYMSDSARVSIENARKRLPNVEFISRKVPDGILRRVYRKLMDETGTTCLCPSLAYVLFYPEMTARRIPCFIAGNEPVQALGLYYNHMAPKAAYSFADNRFFSFVINAGRVMTFRPPLKRGQFHTLATMRTLVRGESLPQRLSGYSNPLVRSAVEALREAPELIAPLKKSLRKSSASGNIPAFLAVDLDEICGGRYDWEKVKDTIVEECGWAAPEGGKKLLHTSCSIEKCKDYFQLRNFRECRTHMIPFSAIEISLAGRGRPEDREKLIYEEEKMLGFAERPEEGCELMRRYVEGI